MGISQQPAKRRSYLCGQLRRAPLACRGSRWAVGRACHLCSWHNCRAHTRGQPGLGGVCQRYLSCQSRSSPCWSTTCDLHQQPLRVSSEVIVCCWCAWHICRAGTKVLPGADGLSDMTRLSNHSSPCLSTPCDLRWHSLGLNFVFLLYQRYL